MNESEEPETKSAWDPDEEPEEADVEAVYSEGYMHRVDNDDGKEEDCPYDDSDELLMQAWLHGWNDANNDYWSSVE